MYQLISTGSTQPSMRCRASSTPSGGFALVIALSLMAFVLLLVLSMSTLLQVEQMSAAQAKQQLEAKQAALLSLNMAVGKLQELAGVDQRVTAPAEAVASVNGSMQLTGVWRSWEGNDHNKSTGLPFDPDYGTKLETGDQVVGSSNDGRFLSWLVSSAHDPSDTTDYDATNPPSLKEDTSGRTTVSLVGVGSVGDNSEDEVHLQPTDIDDGNVAIAWWISGENTKAFIHEDQEPTDAAGWSQRLASDARSDPVAFDLEDDEKLARVSSLQSLNLAASSGSAVTEDYFHDMTVFSRGLLTNTANGGWKRDLSLMAEQWSDGNLPTSNLSVFTAEPYADALESSLKLSDNSTNAAIYPWVTADNISMSWNALMDFVALYKKVKTNDISGEPYFNAVPTNSSDWTSIWPVLARAHFVFGYDATKSGDVYTPRFLFKSSVTMWNPYSVAVEFSAASLLHVRDTSFPIDLYVKVGDQPEVELDLGELLSYRTSSNYARYSTFVSKSDDQTWKPGESRIFGQPGGSGEKTNWNVIYTDPGFSIFGSMTLPLSHQHPITNGDQDDEFSYRWTYKDEAGSDTLSPDLQFYWNRNASLLSPEGENLRNKSVSYRMQNSMATAKEKLPLPELTNDQQTLHSAYEEDSPFLAISIGLRTLVNEDDPLGEGIGILPKAHTKGYMNTKLIAPSVNTLGTASVEDSPYTWEIFSPNTWEDPYMPQSDDAHSYGNDHSSYVGTSFQAQHGLNRWIIAELPTQPLLSLGELQHFDVSFRNQYPPRVANAIGNSHASPHIASDKVANSSINLASYDHSYVSNHVLFDDWFFSSITPDNEGYSEVEDRSIETVYADHLSGKEVLRNRHYKPASILSESEASTEAADFLDEDDAWLNVASKLEVEGMFNINSTSVEAWTALLRNLRKASVPSAVVGDSVTGQSISADEWSIDLDESADGGSSADSGTPVARTIVAADPLSASDPAIAVVATHVILTDEQVQALAEAIVAQIKLRGPFLSLSEFVNRRLDTDEDLALAGAIESALIALSELGNDDANPFNEIQQKYPQQAVLPSDASMIYEFSKAAVGDAAYGTPGWPRQADILRPLAPIISARDDTFRIRAYGASKNRLTGKTQSSIVCEAVVQRKAGYVDSTNDSTDYTNLSDMNQELGRRFEIVSFRWLSEDEI